MPEKRVNGVRLYYEEHGLGDPILCIHGTSSSAMIWGSAVDELEQLGRLIVYDRRGCTRSERPEPYVTNVSQHAEDAAALLDALDAVPAVVIGRSYGGETALGLAIRHPDRIRALVLLEAAVLTLSPEASQWAERLSEHVRSTASEDIERVGEVFIRAVLGDAAWESFPDPMKQMFTDNGPAILAEFDGGFLDADVEALARIDKPTLLVAATDSPEPFRQVTARMAEAIPNSRLELVGGGHFVNPANPAVLDFVREVLA